MTPDSFLIEQVATGDRTAMKALYERYSGSLQRFVRAWLADPHEAADVMQETLLEVWTGAGRYSGRSSVKSWMFGIARNKAIDRSRRAARTVSREADPDISDEAPTPPEGLAAFQDAERVRACIETLSAPHRAAIHLAFYEDLTYAEIAGLESCPVGTVKTRIMHAKSLLLHCLRKSGD